MEWTEEKMKKVQQELQKTWSRERSTHGRNLTFSSIWHELLEPFGIRAKYFPDGTEPKCGEGELLFGDPYPHVVVREGGHHCFLVIPKETAEKILILGL